MGVTAKSHESGHSGDDLRQGVTAITPDGAMTDRPLEDGPFDEFYLSPDDRKAYGIRDDEDPYWARDPEFWMPRGENINRVKQLEGPVHRGGVKGRLVTNAEYDRVHLGGGTTGDLVLMAIPKSMTEQQQAEIDASNVEYQAKLKKTDRGYEGREDTLEMEGLEERMRVEHEQNQRSGLIGEGSPTRGMSYPEAVAYMRRRGPAALAELASKQEMLRNGGYHTEISQEDFSAVMSGQRRLHGMGNSGFGRNQNSAVAQAARREQGGAK